MRAVLQPRRRRVGQRGAQAAPAGPAPAPGPPRASAEQRRQRPVQRRRGRRAGGQPVAQRAEVARPAAAERQPAERARHVGRARAAPRAGGSPRRGLASSHDQPSWRAGDRGRIGQRRGQPAPPAAARPAAVRVRCTAASSVWAVPPSRARAISRLARVAASSSSRPASPERRRARQPRQLAGLGRAHVVERQHGGHRLGIGEAAERLEAGGAERLGQPAAGHQRRRRRGVGAAAGLPLAQRQRRPGRGSPAGSSRPSSAGSPPAADRLRSRTGRWRHRARRAPTSSPAAAASASSRLGRPGSSSASSVSVPGVIRRTTSRRIGAFAGARLRVLHLLGDRDAEAAADQAGEVGLGGMHRHAAHRDRLAGMLAALGQRDVERGGGGLGVGEEQLVEIAHAEEHAARPDAPPWRRTIAPWRAWRPRRQGRRRQRLAAAGLQRWRGWSGHASAASEPRRSDRGAACTRAPRAAASAGARLAQ